MKVFLIIISCFAFVYGSSPEDIPKIVLDAIKDTECLKMNGISKDAFIRINKKRDVALARKKGYHIFKKHLIVCKNAKECSEITSELIKIGIKNLDLGPYQINYMYHGKRWDNKHLDGYFVDNIAEKRAREILWDLICAYGYSWRTIGRYHHYSPKNKRPNRLYYGHIYKYINGSDVPLALTQ